MCDPLVEMKAKQQPNILRIWYTSSRILRSSIDEHNMNVGRLGIASFPGGRAHDIVELTVSGRSVEQT